MDRGVATFSPEVLEALLASIDWDMLPEQLSERLKSGTPDGKGDIRVFLSAEEAEGLLDSMDLKKMKEDPDVKAAYESIQSFLTNIRTKKQGFTAT